jgi:hypothetical protein
MTALEWLTAFCAVALCLYLLHTLIHPDRY